MSQGINFRARTSGTRARGSLAEWNDERGFGFVTPRDGGPRRFVHISAFSGRQRRPQVGDTVTYTADVDGEGRPRCVNVILVGEPVRAADDIEVATPTPWAWAGVATFLVCVVVATMQGRLHVYVPIAYLAASAIAYAAYGLDKGAALRNAWRIPEDTLHAFALVGGWPGALLAQQRYRHKTRKRSFRWMFWTTVAMNSAFTGWLVSPAGMHMVKILT